MSRELNVRNVSLLASYLHDFNAKNCDLLTSISPKLNLKFNAKNGDLLTLISLEFDTNNVN